MLVPHRSRGRTGAGPRTRSRQEGSPRPYRCVCPCVCAQVNGDSGCGPAGPRAARGCRELLCTPFRATPGLPWGHPGGLGEQAALRHLTPALKPEAFGAECQPRGVCEQGSVGTGGLAQPRGLRSREPAFCSTPDSLPARMTWPGAFLGLDWFEGNDAGPRRGHGATF